ncbi:WD40 repeat domain-containing protein [Candidatus Poribacteria bacterium]|jgi:dipeptidyl aminopeptidase/acylaminoacyl peptidase|nr:WD40 repeat domain-containing protein [Candidatus Poribacteria bacterium]MBT5531597.1 WD40 repeat domain-containing protein [Candidatus Poribacteria bacterium]MBT5709782.1 WD40 repeat domain-containing protein [Candidatus Poribacteria bacterium]MBT7097017.1 WD40 repeat domain-containing protein [Candidatus Poribacteria bacterium]MBT7805748.1 WD40 repeat domain-containing protein [Candidatus Poribacteria bacterium]
MIRLRTHIGCLIALTVFLTACGGDEDSPSISVDDADALAFVYAHKPRTPALVVYKSGEALTVLSEDGGATASGAVFAAPGIAPLFVEGGRDGLPTRAYVDGYTFVFADWLPTTLDMTVVNPSGVAEVFAGIDRPVAVRAAPMSLQGSSSAESVIRTGQGLIAVGACAIGEIVPVLRGSAVLPIAAIACRKSTVNASVMLLEETAPDSPWARGLAIADSALAAAGCADQKNSSTAACVDVALSIAQAVVDEAGDAAPLAVEALRGLNDPLRYGAAERWGSPELLADMPGGGGTAAFVVFSPDGDTLAIGAGAGVRLKAADGQVSGVPVSPGLRGSVVFSPDGDTLAVGGASSVTLWDVNTREKVGTLRGHERSVLSVAFSPDGRTLASGSVDRTVRLWDVNARQEIATLRGHASWVNSVAFSPDGNTLASGGHPPEPLKLWDVDLGKAIATLQGHTDAVHCVAFSPDGQRLASASDDETVKFWAVQARREVATLDSRTPGGRDGGVLCVAFSPDGQTVATGLRDHTVKLWATNARREIVTLVGHGAAVHSVAFSPDGETLASGSGNQSVKLWSKTARVTHGGHTHARSPF